MNDSFEVTVGPEGRVLIPAGIRHAAHMEPGTRVVVRLEDGRVVLIPRHAVRRQLLDLFSGTEGSMATELIVQRRAEARRDTNVE